MSDPNHMTMTARLFEIEKVAISDHVSCEQAFGAVKTMIYELRRDVEAAEREAKTPWDSVADDELADAAWPGAGADERDYSPETP